MYVMLYIVTHSTQNREFFELQSTKAKKLRAMGKRKHLENSINATKLEKKSVEKFTNKYTLLGSLNLLVIICKFDNKRCQKDNII